MYADNAVIVDGYRQGIDHITGAFETKLVWLSGQEELCDLLLGRISGRADQALLDAYRVNEGIQNLILLDYDTVRPLLQPALQYDAFCEQAAAQGIDVIELCLRNLYDGNRYVQQALADGTYTAETLEQDLTALIAREREKSCLAILYVYEPSLFPDQTVQSAAYQALLTARFCDEMFAYELLVSYDTAVTLPEPAAYLNDSVPK